MPKIQRLRAQAFHNQHGHCCYCNVPMWLTTPDELKPLGLSPRNATPLRCTAEHLIARQDGGRDVEDNIAAACWLCNQRRHNRKLPPTSGAYRTLVRQRLAKGKWHPLVVARLRAAG